MEKHKYYKFVSNDFHKKLLFSLGKAKTKYIIWIGDDDFINFRSLKHTLMFLKKNKSYSAAHGQYVKFNEKKFRVVKEYHQAFHYFYKLFKVNNNINELEYFYKTLSNFYSPSHAICKKKPFIHALKFIIKHPDLNPTFLVIKL